MSNTKKLSFAVRDQIMKMSGSILQQYLSISPEKRHELESQGVNLGTMYGQQLYSLFQNTKVSSVLIVMEEGIGNMVLLTPALRSLKHCHPLLKITVWCKEPAASVIRGWECVDNVITSFDFKHYDLLFATIWSQNTLNQFGNVLQQYTKATIVSQFKLFHETLQHMGLNDFLDCDGDLPPSHCETAKGDELDELDKSMQSLKLEKDKYIVFGDTALRLPTGGWDVKRWPHYQELAKLINKKFPQYKIVLIGNKEDLEEAKQKEWAENVELGLMGNLSIPQLATVLERCHLYIGNDTGPTHIAAAVGAKTYAIFAPTMVAKNLPLGKDVHILNKRMPCSPCQYTEKFNNCECMSYHTAQEVYNEVFYPNSNQKKRVLLVGSFSGGGALGTFRNEHYIKKVMEREYKCKVITHDYRVILEKEGNDPVAATYKLVNDILHYEPDLVLICGGQNIHPHVLNSVNQLMPKIKMACWYVDNRRKVEPWFAELSRVCHNSFWSTGCPELLSQCFAQTQNPCEFLPIVPDHESFKPLDVEKDIDVLFVGTPHSPERLQLLEYLVENLPKDVKFEVYGNGGWPEKLKKIAKPGVFDAGFNKVLNRAKIVINQNIVNDVPLYFSDRYFYPMATKTVGLNKYIPNLEDMFVDGKHMVFWNTPEDACDKIQKLLKDEKKMKYVSEQGHKLYLNKYTLLHILSRLFESTVQMEKK